jgi:hypothetical protein
MDKNAKTWQQIMRKQDLAKQNREPEFSGPAWKHPYMLYCLLTVLLFIFLLGMAYMAIQNDWIPSRGIGH